MVELLEAQWFASRAEEKTKIKYVTENKKTKFVSPKFDPYFFIKRKDKLILKEYERWYLDVYDNSEFITFDGESAVKITCMYPSDVRGLRNEIESKGVETQESDIPFTRRWQIDEGHRQCELRDILSVDIETDARYGFPSAKKAKYRIFSIACVDNKGNEYFFCDTEEERMLSEFFWLITQNYHVMTGWNFTSYDLKYLSNRCKVLKLKRMFAPIQYLDALWCYRKNTTLETKGFPADLDSVSNRFLGLGKIKRPTGQQMYDSLVSDPEHKVLREYNMRDAVLVKYLNEIIGLLDPFISSVNQYPLMLKDMDKMSVFWEAQMLDDCKDMNPRPVMPRKKTSSEQKELVGKLRGAIIKDPVPGVHWGVAVLDFKSMYNSIMQALSISPEFIVPFENYLVEEHGYDEKTVHHYDVDKDFVRLYCDYVRHSKDIPIFTRLLRETEEHRNYAKQQRDIAKKEGDKVKEKYWDVKQLFYKTVLVSSYGVQGFKSGRFFNPNLINMITFIGRQMILKTAKIFNEFGWNNLYSHTDSIMIKKGKDMDILDWCLSIESIAQDATTKLRKWIRNEFNVIEPDRIFLEAQEIYNPMLLASAKNRYIGKLIWKEGVFVDERVYKGFESKRTDSFQLLRDVQDNVASLMFEHEVEAGSFIDDYMRQIHRNLINGEYDNLLIIEKRMNKDMDEYKNQNIPILRVVKDLIEEGLFEPEEPIRYITTKISPKRIDSPVLSNNEILLKDFSGKAYRTNMFSALDITARQHYHNMISRMVDKMSTYLGDPQTTLEDFST